MSEERQYVTNFTFPNGETYYVKDTEAREDIEELKKHGGGNPNAVLYTPQTLNPAQQEQARENIGAAAAGEGGSTIYATPEQFGAVGDGVTDDTAAVRQAMQNPAVALHNTYKVTEAISCVANVVVGNGDAKILASGDCLNFSDNVVLSDFAIETPNQTDGVAIKAQKDISAERLAITGGRIGIRVEGSYYKTVVRGCTFKNLWGDSAAAVHVLFAGITEFTANLVEGVSNDLDRDADGIRIWQSKGVENVCAEIHGNEFHNCRGRFIKASTYNCSIRDNYCHNDSGFATITNAIGIDVQKGNSDVRNNMILASSGINISVRVDDVSHHIVEHNTFKLVESSGSNPHLRAISVTDYGDATTKTDVTIRENYIDWGNNVSIYLPYVGNSIIRALSNHVVGRQGDAVSFRGTFDATCRFEMLGNLNDEYTYFARFSGCIPNVLGDRKIFAADPIAFSSVLPMTSYVANTTALDGFGNTAFLETLGGVSSFSIQLSTNSQFGVYKINGKAVYYFAGAYVNKVNGKTGVVTLTASDVGAGTYSKPASGIPASDLASGVQTSLGKADTALQEHQSLADYAVKSKLPSPHRIINIGHRGALPSEYPENTAPAFAAAAKQGFDYAEFDVRATSDGVLVCLHDATINRVARNADGTTISGGDINIADITYAQAQNYVFCSGLYSAYPTIKICTVEDAIKTCAMCGIGCWFDMYIEPTTTVLNQIFGWLDAYNMRDRAVFNSATYNYVAAIKAYDPAIALSTRSSTYSNLEHALSGIGAFDTGKNRIFVNVRQASMPTYAPAFHARGWYVLDSTLNPMETMADYAPYLDAVLEEDFLFSDEIADYIMENSGQASTPLLNLNRSSTKNTSAFYNDAYYLNPAQYNSANLGSTDCVVADLTESSITVTEGGQGGTGCAFPFNIENYYGKTLKLKWNATGTTDTRFRLIMYGGNSWKHGLIDNSGSKSESTIQISADGMTITIDGTATTSERTAFTYVAFFFGAATSKTVSYSGVTLTEQ